MITSQLAYKYVILVSYFSQVVFTMRITRNHPVALPVALTGVLGFWIPIVTAVMELHRTVPEPIVELFIVIGFVTNFEDNARADMTSNQTGLVKTLYIDHVFILTRRKQNQVIL